MVVVWWSNLVDATRTEFGMYLFALQRARSHELCFLPTPPSREREMRTVGVSKIVSWVEFFDSYGFKSTPRQTQHTVDPVHVHQILKHRRQLTTRRDDFV